ncbi:hypothetical protein A4U61_09955 [Streptomyces sp. H-KF8]|nr:hypothetical protein A4U61_09955 [Streptomyces sp. H-KF8]
MNGARARRTDDDTRKDSAMTVPEENRPKTETTDQVVATPDEQENKRGDESKNMREAMEEAGITPEDYEK